MRHLAPAIGLRDSRRWLVALAVLAGGVSVQPEARATGAPGLPPGVDPERAMALFTQTRDLLDEPDAAPVPFPGYVPRSDVVRPAGPPTAPPYRELELRRDPEVQEEDAGHLERLYESGLSPDEARLATRAALSAPSESSSARAETAVSISPDSWSPVFTAIENPADGNYFAGRATQVSRAWDPLQGLQTLWLGTVGGGLWKLVEAPPFAFWAPVSRTLPGSPSVGAFVVRPSNGLELLIGSGDPLRYGGDGIYKSVDGGATWSATDILPKPGGVYALRADNSDDSVVLAATTIGIFRSANFGDSWLRLTNASASAVLQDPVSPGHWYAAVPGTGVLESSDGGLTFLPFGGGCGVIPGSIGRIGLAVSPAAANFVYALVAKADGNLNGIYRSGNYGCTWTAIETVDAMGWGQGNHALGIAVHPGNPDLLYIGMGGGQWTANATAASPCWVRNGGGSDCGIPYGFLGGHVDFTSFLFSSGPTVYFTNDGGIFEHVNGNHPAVDVGNGAGLVTLQSFDDFKMMTTSRSEPETLLLGLQDNGTARVDGAYAWLVRGGDGAAVTIDPDDPANLFFSSGLSNLRWGSNDGGASIFQITCGLAGYGAAEVVHEPTPGIPSAQTFVFATGQGPDSQPYIWHKPPAPGCDWAQTHSTPFPVAVRGIDQANDPLRWTLYATNWWDDRRLFVADSGNPGAMTFADRTPVGLAPATASLGAKIYADRNDGQPGTAYYTTGRSRPIQAFVTTDRGQSWREVTGNLPRISGNVNLFELIGDPTAPETLFVGTELGVFRTDSALALYPVWYRYMNGLPEIVRAFHLEVNSFGLTTPVVRLGTYGQGFWEREIGPTSFLFADGFESSSTIAWSAHVP